MKHLLFWSIALLTGLRAMDGIAQEDSSFFPLSTTEVIAIYNKEDMYYVVKECEDLRTLHSYFRKNKHWAKKLLKKGTRNKNGLVDIFVLVDVIEEPPYLLYYYGTHASTIYDETSDNYVPEAKRHHLEIELPHELFTRENIWKLYEYVISHIQISEELPYFIDLGENEIMKILKQQSLQK